MKEMTTRQRFQALMNFQPFDRLPVVEWAQWWEETIERWYGEGLPPSITDRYEICKYLDLDIFKQDWFPECTEECPQPAYHGASIMKTEKDYDALRPYLFPLPAVDKKQWALWAEEQARGDIVIWFTVVGFFWFPRTLFGIEEHLYAFYDQPKLMHRMNEDLMQWILAIIDEISEFCAPDFMTFAEDMSYNHGPMISKDLYDEFMKPYYREVLPALKKLGVIPIIDSDGDITEPADWFEEDGLEGILPLERQAGVDIAKLREDHPGMKFIGHFDKMTMDKGEAAMRAEFERLLPTVAKGGYLVGCDHQTPPGVSFEDYKLFLSLFREYADKAGQMSRK
ncbi:MAG: uroporphyrinogen decarboxylase family protein [candidate division KSB1 bacterium]|jgi:hypothetical protein|nr:uroporphyrinogen decarboxylase family protein [candidate division KSB1 bacterium]